MIHYAPLIVILFKYDYSQYGIMYCAKKQPDKASRSYLMPLRLFLGNILSLTRLLIENQPN